MVSRTISQCKVLEKPVFRAAGRSRGGGCEAAAPCRVSGPPVLEQFGNSRQWRTEHLGTKGRELITLSKGRISAAIADSRAYLWLAIAALSGVFTFGKYRELQNPKGSASFPSFSATNGIRLIDGVLGASESKRECYERDC